MKTTNIKTNYCPYCDEELDALTSEHGHKPREGDVSLCIECHNILIINKDLTVRKPTDEEIDSLDSEVFKEIDELKKSLDTINTLADGITKKENKKL